MVILNELLEDVALSEVPLIKTLFYKHGTDTSAIGLKKGVTIGERTWDTRCVLCVIEGEIVVDTATHEHRMTRFDTLDVSRNTAHSITAASNAIVIVIQDDLKNQPNG